MKQLITTTIFSLLIYLSNAQQGSLDLTFGEGGKFVSQTFDALINTSLIQSDGKIVGGGFGGYDSTFGFFLARVNTDGSLDEGFGNKGRVVNDLGSSDVSKTIYSIALQPDGKIVAAGQYAISGDDSKIAVMRFNTDGSIDKNFGDTGLAVTTISGYYDIVRDMSLLPDGRIVVTGDTEKGINDNNRSFIVCYTVDGRLDETFGNNGVAIISLENAMDVTSIAVTSIGKILIGGFYRTNFERNFLQQYDGQGKLDLTFGNKGLAEMPFGQEVIYVTLNDIAIAKDGSILGTGNAQIKYFAGSINVCKWLSDGKVDSTFGKNGYSIRSFRDYTQSTAIALQEDGRIVTAGYNGDDKTGGFMAVRYKYNGAIDSSFGNNGTSITFLNGYDIANDVNIQEDGKIVVAGTTFYQNYPIYHNYMAVVRYDNKPVQYVKIKRWLHRYGFTWEDCPQQICDKLQYYAVQRSTGGNAFAEIARIFNHGNAATQSFEDKSPANGANYYRVAAVSRNNSINYSNIIAIDHSTANIKVYPNPVKNILRIEGLRATAKTKLSITDLNGNIRMTAIANAATYLWNVSLLPKGNYVLKTEFGGAATAAKFMKE